MVEQAGKVSCIKRATRYLGILPIALYQPPGYLGLLSKDRTLTANDVIAVTLNNIGQAVGWQAWLGCRHQTLQNHAGWTGLGWAGLGWVEQDPRLKKAGLPACPNPDKITPETDKGGETYPGRVQGVWKSPVAARTWAAVTRKPCPDR